MSEQLTIADGIERRMVEMEVRLDNEDDKPTISGLGAVFNKRAEIFPGFFEEILPGAFDDVLKSDDVRALFNHDSNNILGRKSAGTLELRSDKKGLDYKIFPPDTQVGRDVQVSIDRGDVTGSSFSFTVAKNGDSWEERDDGTVLRTITKIKSLGDIGPVTFPAYNDTTVAVRSRDDFQAKLREVEAGVLAAVSQIKIQHEHRERVMQMALRG